jgi:predicted nucleic acid-binding protein
MIHSSKFSVVLDACVLYPAPVRDILLSLAAEGLFKPKWTQEIQNEWVKNLLKNRTDLNESSLDYTINAMNNAFPDANVTHYESLIPALILPDLNDRHVLACAIRSKADLITTFNLKDFPKHQLKHFDLDVQHPDELISNLVELNEINSCLAFSKMVDRLKNPTKSVDQVLENLRNLGLKTSVNKLEKLDFHF